MALPATDTFDRANSTSNLNSSNWSAARLTMGIFSNAAYCNSSGDDAGWYWNADSFSADQYSQATIAALASGTWIGVAVRLNAGSGGTYYGYYADGSSEYLFKVINGVFTELASGTIVWAVGQVMRIEVEGTTLRVRRNGTQVRTITDSSISSGSAGICGYSNATGSRVDDWEGGNLSEPPVVEGGTLTAMRGIWGP